jgi:hypothetical protein
VPDITTTIDRGQREGLYELVRNHLGASRPSGSRWSAPGTSPKAERLGLEFAEDFRLLGDIGWGEEDERERFALTMPAYELLELLGRLHDEAVEVLTESGAEARASREDATTNRRFQLGYRACEAVLAELEPGGGGGRG